MNVNKKFDRFKQWAGEKMGAEAKTSTSADFQALELEMNLRHEGMERLHKSMSQYVKAIGKKSEGDERDKQLPIGYLGTTMVGHGHDFSPDSEFGNCLISLGRANENISRRQEGYMASATTVWLESLERSLAQMKEYQAARKKLEARRLAYDASLAKMQKAKKEDFRVEEELRGQKAKYEESSEDVYRRMEDVKEAEVDSIADLTKFLEEELAYHQSCTDILANLKRSWPGVSAAGANGHANNKPAPRARANTAHSFQERINPVDEEPELPPRVTIPKLSRADSLRTNDTPLSRTNSNRNDSPTSANGGGGLSSRPYTPEIATDMNLGIFARPYLRPVNRVDSNASDTSSPRNPSPPSSVTSFGGGGGGADGFKKVPPPPPSRAKKPAPPPPMKRATFSATSVPTSTY